MHQVQHLLLGMIEPMLLFLAAPQRILVAGTPDWVQRRIVTPVIANRIVRGFFGVLAHPMTPTESSSR